MRQPPWWTVVSAATAPVLLIGGWTVAAGLQARPFDPVRQSVSALAGAGATDRWVMTLAFVAVAVCYIVTGLGLVPAAPAGRMILVAGGLAGLLVAASPEPAGGRFSLAHATWSAAGFAFLAGWPLGAWRRGAGVPGALRPQAAAAAAAVIAALLGWFLAELVTGGGQIGLAERILGSAQALWPLLVVMSCRASARAEDQGPVNT